MKYKLIAQTGLKVPRIMLGCLKMCNMTSKSIQKLVDKALELGVNYFDHADIYGDSESETAFGKALHGYGIPRESILIQSKCGIIEKKRVVEYYDSSKEHIVASVEGSLKRLEIDYLDVLLLHRPDALWEPQEVAEAFEYLSERGMVRHFGVSNYSAMQMRLLSKWLGKKLIFNQMQFSAAHAHMIRHTVNVNMTHEQSVMHDDDVLDYCRFEDITIQAWSPLQYGFMEGVYLGDRDKFPELNLQLDTLAEKYNVILSSNKEDDKVQKHVRINKGAKNAENTSI